MRIRRPSFLYRSGRLAFFPDDGPRKQTLLLHARVLVLSLLLLLVTSACPFLGVDAGFVWSHQCALRDHQYVTRFAFAFRETNNSLHNRLLNADGGAPLLVVRRARRDSHNDNNNDDDSQPGGGYKFGDLTRSLAKRAAKRVNDLTGKESYEFGDLSRFLDAKAKARVQAIKEGARSSSPSSSPSTYKYEFGDFTRWADALAKEKAAQFAGKQSSEDYRLGDISRTIVAKVRSGEYSLDDVYLALRVLLTAGFSVLPIASLLPVKGLIQLVNLGLAKDVSGRLMEVLVVALDQRMKLALAGDANYQLGDKTKEQLRLALTRFTGKDSYQVGDITKAAMQRVGGGGTNGDYERKEDSRGTSSRSRGTANGPDNFLTLQDSVVDDLASWDQKFFDDLRLNSRSQGSMLDSEYTQELAEWDRKFMGRPKAIDHDSKQEEKH